MNDKKVDDATRGGLNPDLQSRTDTSRDTDTPTRPPAESASVQREEGGGWPVAWLVVVVICVLAAIYIIVG